VDPPPWPEYRAPARGVEPRPAWHTNCYCLVGRAGGEPCPTETERSRESAGPRCRNGQRSSAVRIAQVAPLYECVPPRLYGGTERVVAYLTDQLVRQGHEVTLFASGDSKTAAEHVPIGRCATRLDPDCRDPLARHILLLERVFSMLAEFAVVHFPIDYLHFPLTRRYRESNLTTLHGRLDIPDLAYLYDEYTEMPVVSISNSQRAPLPHLN